MKKEIWSRFVGEERGGGEGKMEKVTSLVILCSNYLQALFFQYLSSVRFPCVLFYLKQI